MPCQLASVKSLPCHNPVPTLGPDKDQDHVSLPRLSATVTTRSGPLHGCTRSQETPCMRVDETSETTQTHHIWFVPTPERPPLVECSRGRWPGNIGFPIELALAG